MVIKTLPDAATVRKALDYNPETGTFLWKFRPTVRPCWNGRRPGTKAGHIQGSGYLAIQIDGKVYQAHRLAWLLMTDQVPAAEIDHINNDKTDNRFANLREASRQENRWNTPKYGNNTSGFKGVAFHRETGKWGAYYQAKGKRQWLGLFETPEAAHAAYCAAAKSAFGKFFNAGHCPSPKPRGG